MVRSRRPLMSRLVSAASTALTVAMWTVPAVPAAAAAVVLQPAVSDVALVSSGLTPPSEAQCFALGRRCWMPGPFENAYNLPPLYAAGNQGQGITIALVDSFGSQTIRADLNNFNNQFGLPHMCGEDNHTCAAGDPTFNILCVQACTDAKSQPPTANDP